MKFKETEPTLYVYAPNRTTLYGCTPLPNKLSINYRFNTFSEMSFEIRKYYYNERKEEWVKNSLYDKIEKNNLIKIPNDNPVFKYSVNELYDDDEYDIDRNLDGTPNYNSQVNRRITTNYFHPRETLLKFNATINRCTLQPETELFDISGVGGYGWNWYGKINSGFSDEGDIEPKSGGYVENTSNISDLVNQSFFPVQVGDIIAYGCLWDNDVDLVTSQSNAKYKFGFCPFFYTRADSGSCVHIGHLSNTNSDTNNIYLPVGRCRVKNGNFGSYTYTVNSQQKVKYLTDGYVRIKGKDSSNHSQGVYYAPAHHMVKIFSGERRCASVSTKSAVTLQHGIPWWVIVNIEEEKNGIDSVKKVTAYSYEYTLANRTFSIDEDTLPLYIPDNIPKLVTSDEFPIDKYDGDTYCGAQRMKRGLVNQILDNVSGWRVRYISNGMCTKYRKIEDVDNMNIYTFLMNTVQSLFQCYLIFDTENLLINIISQSSLINNGIPSNTRVSWRNVLKSINVKNIDDNYVTALKVHSEEDTYGLSLVNPNGTNIIYNFQNVKDSLDYVVDEKHLHNGTPYTLKELIELYEDGVSSTSVNFTLYRSAAKTLIESNKKVIEYKVRLSEMLTEYHKEVDKNNILVKAKCEADKKAADANKVSWLYADEAPETPPVDSQFNSSKRWSYSPNASGDHHHHEAVGSSTTVRDCWASKENFGLIRKAAENYWEAYDTYVQYETDLAKSVDTMKQIAMKYSFNINTLKKQFAENNNNGYPTNGYVPIFTPTEIIELYKYIYEGDWTNENVVFNEEYSADDIYDTLVDLYDVANTEMSRIYSKPTLQFETVIANICHIPEMKTNFERLFIGNTLNIYDDTKWIEPILLEFKYDYDNYMYSPMVLTTDYNRKPKEMRFYELFSTIQQTSVQTPTFTFDN